MAGSEIPTFVLVRSTSDVSSPASSDWGPVTGCVVQREPYTLTPRWRSENLQLARGSRGFSRRHARCGIQASHSAGIIIVGMGCAVHDRGRVVVIRGLLQFLAKPVQAIGYLHRFIAGMRLDVVVTVKL